jgi:hypothetical protein
LRTPAVPPWPARRTLRSALLIFLKDLFFSFPLLLEQKWSKIQGGTNAIPALLKKLEKQSG